MKINININGKEVEITLTPEQIASITKNNQKLIDRVRTMDDVYSELSIDKAKFESSFIFPEDLDSAKIRLIYKVFNEGWQPDWTNSNENKYYPYFESKNGGGFSCSGCDFIRSGVIVSSRLYLKNKELALKLPKIFPTEFENYFLIKK